MRRTRRITRKNKTRRRFFRSGSLRRRSLQRRSLRSRSLRRRSLRGGSITTPMVGTLEGEEHKGLNKIVVAGPKGVMSGTAYLQLTRDLDQQGIDY